MISTSHKTLETLEVTCSSREEAFAVRNALTTEMSTRYRWEMIFLGTVGGDLTKIIVQFQKETSRSTDSFQGVLRFTDYWQDYSNANYYEEKDDDY